MDKIIRAVCFDAGVRITGIDARELTERARTIHNTLPLASAALGRTLMAASMMGAELKAEDASLTMQIKGDGPLGSILAVSDSHGNVRGYLQNPAALLPLKPSGKLDVCRGVGAGTLTVIKDLRMRDPFTGTIELVSGEIAEDVSAYLVQSEQIPSAVALGVLVDRDQSIRRAGGYIVSALPGAKDEDMARIEANITAAGDVTAMLERGMTIEEILRRIVTGYDMEILDEYPVEYRCNCSEQRVRRALISMGKEELASLAEEQETVEITCQFCDKVYRFDRQQIQNMLRNL